MARVPGTWRDQTHNVWSSYSPRPEPGLSPALCTDPEMLVHGVKILVVRHAIAVHQGLAPDQIHLVLPREGR